MKFKVGRKILEFDSRVLAEREAQRLGVECVLLPEELPDLVEKLTRECERLERDYEQQRAMIDSLTDYVRDLEAGIRTCSSVGHLLRNRK